MFNKEKLIYTCEAQNFSDKTISNYLGSVTKFENWLLKNKKEINIDSLMEFFSILRREGNATATRKLHACALRFYFKNIEDNKEFASFLPSIRQESKKPVVLSKEEVKTLIGCIENKKHRAYIILLYSCGLRLSELMDVKMGDFGFDRKNLLINGKGNRQRFVPLSDNFINYYNQYKHLFSGCEYFCSRRKDKQRMHNRSISSIITRAAFSAKITKRVYPHLLRHSFATHCIDSGIDIRYVQVVLGHANILCTAQYTHISTMPNDINNMNLAFLNEH